MNRRSTVWLAAAAGAVMLGAGAAAAAVGPGWAFSITPYMWLTEMNGDVDVGRVNAPVDVSFNDSLDMINDLRGALMLHGEAKHGALSGLADIYAISVRQADATAVGEADLRLTQYIGELALAYALPVGGDGVRVEALGGARYQLLRTRIQVDAIGVDIDEDEGWTDPFVGGRVSCKAGETVTLAMRGDVGGFGVGSDLAWNAVGSATWAFAESWSAVLAYRFLDVDYERGHFKYNVRTDGPALGLSYTF